MTIAMAMLGARIEEVAQLDLLHDLVHDHQAGAWHLRLRAEEGTEKSIKSVAGWRSVPIPTALVKLGFADFLIAAKKNAKHRPFETQWQPHRSSDGLLVKWSHAITKWGSRELDKLRAKGLIADSSATYFHSLRHTFATELASAGVSEEFRAAIQGHEYGGENAIRYSKLRQQPEALRSEMERGLQRLSTIVARVIAESSSEHL